MTNVYVGFHDQRNSSRVLKPPGGGTSDIFGTDPPKITKNDIEIASPPAKNEIDITSKPNSEANDKISNEENSTNGDCAENVDQEEKVDPSKPDSEEPKIENLNITEENEETTVTKNIEENQSESKSEIKASATTESISTIIQQQEKQNNEPEKRTSHRVPPGGYSSGLW